MIAATIYFIIIFTVLHHNTTKTITSNQSLIIRKI